MTLVAIFKVDDIPMMIGDLLISRNNQPVGCNKKVHLIGPNFAIGWSGDFLAACVVIPDIYAEFGERRVTYEEVKTFLTMYPSSQKLGQFNANFMAWIVEDQPRGFLWNSGWGAELQEREYDAIGSGEDTFTRFCSDEIVNMIDEGSSLSSRYFEF